MSIEEQLSEAYKSTSAKLRRPAALDAQIEQQFRKPSSKKQTKLYVIKKSWTVRFVAAALLLTTLGFSAQYLISFKDYLVNYVIVTDQSSNYDEKLAADVRESLEEAKKSLPVGERGIFYSNSLKQLLPKSKMPPIVLISNPYIWTEEQAWEEQLEEANVNLHLPETLAKTLRFIGGQRDYAFGGLLTANNQDDVDKLLSLVKEKKLDEAWHVLPHSQDDGLRNPVYTTTYESRTGARIDISMEIFSQKTKIQMQAQLADQEQFSIGEQLVTYTLNKRMLFSDMNEYHSLVWLDTQDDLTIMYTIGSPQTDITKTDLTTIAEQFIHE